MEILKVGAKITKNGKFYKIVDVQDYRKFGGEFGYKCHQCELMATEMGSTVIFYSENMDGAVCV